MKSNIEKAVSLVFLASIAITTLAVAVGYFQWDFDDPFIIYRYAWNIVQGNGWSYNPGENYNASTSVLNTALIALTTLFSGDPRASAHVLDGLFIFAAGVVIYMMFKDRFGKALSAAAAVTLVVILGNDMTWGLEVYLFIALGLFFVYLESRRLNTWYVLGLLILARPDGILFLAGKLLITLARERKVPWKGLLQSMLVLLPWVVFSLFTFHQVFPATLQQKVWQGQSGFWGGGMVYLNYLHSLDWKWWLVVPALIGAAFAVKDKSPILYLAYFVVVQQAAYIYLNVPGYHWYTVCLTTTCDLFALYGLGSLIISGKDGLKSPLPLWSGRPAMVLNCLMAATLLVFSIYSYHNYASAPKTDPKLNAYKKLATAINRYVPPGRLAALEVGVVGYYTEREMLDLIGLTTSEGEFATGRQNDRFFKILPRVVVIHSMLSLKEQMIFNDPRFLQYYEPWGIVRSEGYQDVLFYSLRH